MARKYRFRATHCSILYCLAVVAASGCNNNPLGRMPIRGEVKVAGKPLEKGTIDFRPSAGNDGVGSGCPIEQGSFKIEELKGLPPGKYEVRIFSSQPDTSPLPEGVPPGVNRPWIEQIPPEYNVQTKQSIEVTREGPNEFVFEIPANS